MGKIKVTAEQVRNACAHHRSLKVAAAALGITPAHLSRWRRKLGLIERDAAEKRERVRAVLSRPTREAAYALGVTEASIYRLRQRARQQLTTTTEETATP